MCEIHCELGHGAFGKVYLLRLDSGDEFALKVTDIRRLIDQQDQAVAEAKLMHKLCHAHLVQCCNFFMRDSSLYLITELCTNGTLKTYLVEWPDPVKESQVLTWLSQIADALRYLHAYNVIHRDLKTENIFLDSMGNVKVGDLGIARELEYTAERAKTITGTWPYMSPEVIEGSPYTTKADIWGLGCCIHEVMTHSQTFKGESVMKLMSNIVEGQIPPISEIYSEDLRLVVLTALQKNPDKRPDAHEILRKVCQIQHHPYSSGCHKPLPRVEVDELKICRAVKEFEKQRLKESTIKSSEKHLELDEFDEPLYSFHLEKASEHHNSKQIRTKKSSNFLEKNKTGRAVNRKKSASSPSDKRNDNDIKDLDDKVHRPFQPIGRPLPHPRKFRKHKADAESKKCVKAHDAVISQNVSSSVKNSSSVRAVSPHSKSATRHEAQLKIESDAPNSSDITSSSDDAQDEGEDETSKSYMAFSQFDGLAQTYMDNLAMESRQWLQKKFAPDKDEPGSEVVGAESSSDSESLVTLFTRAQKVRYVNKKTKSGNVNMGTDISDIEGDLSSDVTGVAESVIELFGHQDRHQMELLLIQMMGFRDFTIHGQDLIDRTIHGTSQPLA